ncbi:FAD-binding protein, partial [Persicitalea sp.]|uniref:FAD-binding protein n=1 Tax=Persicitalea sp. TaxID=3100273 RepID=UPI003593654A
MNYSELAPEISGGVILRNSQYYDEARSIYNAMIDKKPAAFAKCLNTDDVIAAVNFGRANDLEASILSGGHNGAGLGLVDDGLVIDLSEMNG